MQSEVTVSIDLQEACHAIGLDSVQLVEIIEHGIIAPAGESPADWLFDLQMISTARRASRLQRDLHMEWSAVALIVELLEERDRLRAENAMLLQRLQRFLCD